MKDFHKKESPLLGLTGTGGGLGYLTGGAGAGPLYSEDLFTPFLYEGVSSGDITLTSGIDMAGEGGMVWAKNRDSGVYGGIWDSVRGASKRLRPDSNIPENTAANIVKSFNSDGVTVSTDGGTQITQNGDSFVAWMFRKCPGFFDIVTYPGNSQSGRQIPHSLGSTPGMIIIKNLTNNSGADWAVWHREGGQYEGKLNEDNSFGWEYVTGANDTTFTTTHAGNETNLVNNNYVAYLFAHDAQLFGENEDEAIIKCGKYTGSGSIGKTVNLGFEPQWILVKNKDASTPWVMIDYKRGMPRDGDGVRLLASQDVAEVSEASFLAPTPTGFEVTQQNTYVNTLNDEYVYVAIRRPHKPPTTGTDWFNPVTRSGVNATTAMSSGNSRTTEMIITKNRGSGNSNVISTRLQGQGTFSTDGSDGENHSFWESRIFWDEEAGIRYAQYDQVNQSGSNYIDYFFTKAPGVFDVVAYTGTGSNGLTVPHGLGVTPEMIWVKKRTSTSGGDKFQIYHASQGNGKYAFFGTDPFYTSGARWNNTSPTSTQFTLGTDNDVNANGHKFIAMLFATKSGITKIGSYPGTGGSQNIDCGFTNGARFVMIKRADVEAQNPAADRTNWYVWDSARGIVSGNDPWMAFNESSAENTGTDWIDPLSSGFTVSGTGGAVNVNGGTYVYMAIA